MPVNGRGGFPNRLRRDRALLGVFIFRQATSIALLAWLTRSLFQLDDHRIGWAMVGATTLFSGWVLYVVFRAVRSLRARSARSEASG